AGPGPDVAAPGAPAPGRDASEVDLKALLARFGVPVPAGRLAHNGADAEVAVRDVGGRAVVKAVVPGLLHKTDVGGVVLDVTPEGAAEAYDRCSRLGGAVLVEEMATGGAEVLVGVASSPLGPVLTLATGGVLTEAVDDAVFRLLPVDADEARTMVDDLRGAVLLRGVRGRPALDEDALVRLLGAVSDLVTGWPEGYELDLNPVLVRADGVLVLDAAYVAPPVPPGAA
ncbi:MAG: acetate--CoA ligase family protein, partial [Actinomycetes bacterium]